MNNLTLITASFETPTITETMLKSFKYYNDKFPNIIIIENSRNDETRTMLESHGIGYYKNVGGYHAPSIDIAFNLCKTDYALVVDTDIVFNKDINYIYNEFKDNNYIVAGIESGDRGGLKLYPRIDPWFMLVNVKNIKEHNIIFFNKDKVDRTNSGFLYMTGTLADRNVDCRKYDVGATFLEDCLQHGLKAKHCEHYKEYFTHYEGMSWRGNCNDKELKRIHDLNLLKYIDEIKKYENILLN